MTCFYLFEDSHTSKGYPFHFFKPAFLIKVGIFHLLDYLTIRFFLDQNQPIQLKLIGPPERSEYHLGRDHQFFQLDGQAEKNILLNGGLIPEYENWKGIMELIRQGDEGSVWQNGRLMALMISGDRLNRLNFNQENRLDQILEMAEEVGRIDLKLRGLTYGFEIVQELNSVLNEHLDLMIEKDKQLWTTISPQVYGRESLFDRLKVDFDTSSGKIVIDEGVTIKPFSYLEGPLWIGRQSVIHPHTYLAQSSIGERVKLGGEIRHSLINSYSNKSHYGYLGDSVVGSWVNIAAGTTSSNLKNNFKSVQVSIGEEKIDTRMIHLGAFLGDFSKTAVHTNINPGKMLGLASVAEGVVTENLADFKIKRGPEIKKISWDLWISSVKKMQQRREKKLSERKIDFLKNLYRQLADLPSVV